MILFHLAMRWNCSAHVSFHNELELFSPYFILQGAGMAQPIFRLAMGWNSTAHISFCNELEWLLS
jgi:hypothetical protein